MGSRPSYATHEQNSNAAGAARARASSKDPEEKNNRAYLNVAAVPDEDKPSAGSATKCLITSRTCESVDDFRLIQATESNFTSVAGGSACQSLELPLARPIAVVGGVK